MEHRIVELDNYKLVGFKKESTNENQQGMKDLPAFWNEILSSDSQASLLPLINREPFSLIGASFYNVDEVDSKRFDYYIGVATTGKTPEDMEEIEVPANIWAVFPCTRATNHQTQYNIVTKWAPNSEEYALLNTGYMTGDMVSGGPDIEVFGQGDEVEIWVPVKKK